LQGGFGLSPQQAGLMATPIAMFIAIGSFINTRIVIHLPKPTLILSIGFTLLLAACIALSFAAADTPTPWIEIPMAGIGVGLGFILNNLNVFGQEIAGRERFGITTALLQSTRMVGGMLGTSVVATIVQHHYRDVMTRTLRVLGEPAFSHWLPRFDDPRILIDSALRASLLSDIKPSGLDGAAMVESAREVLVQSIHIGTGLTAVAALSAVLIVRRISGITFTRR